LAWAVEDVIMRRHTTALALAGTLLAAPAVALAADPLEAPIAGHPTVADQLTAERSLNVRQDLTGRAVRLARKLDLSAARERQRLRGAPTGVIRARIRGLERRLDAPPRSTASPVLEAIAACESGGNPTTDTGNGFYGKYQFTLETWAAVGGSGNPAHASEAEQDRRAAALYAQAGPSPWPVCGR
jgi:transglycosylase-like protein